MFEDDPYAEVAHDNTHVAERSNERENDEDDPMMQKCADCGHRLRSHNYRTNCLVKIGQHDVCRCEMFDDGSRSVCCGSRIVGYGQCENCGASTMAVTV